MVADTYVGNEYYQMTERNANDAFYTEKGKLIGQAIPFHLIMSVPFKFGTFPYQGVLGLNPSVDWGTVSSELEPLPLYLWQ